MKALIIVLISCVLYNTPFFAKNKKKDKIEMQKDAFLQQYDSLKAFFTETENGINFIKVIDLPEKKKEQIYVDALVSIAKLYNDSKEVIQTKDKEEGLIFWKGTIKIADRYNGWGNGEVAICPHEAKLEIKDNKCRITLSAGEYRSTMYRGGKPTKFTYQIVSMFPFWKECSDKWSIEYSMNKFVTIHNSFTRMLYLFEKSIKTNALESGKDDW